MPMGRMGGDARWDFEQEITEITEANENGE